MTGDRVVVVGGGLAGISAAIGLAESGLPVTLLEARPWLGGATWSFGRRGLTIDNGQHVFLQCFSAYRDLLRKLGVDGSVHTQDRLDLTVLTSDGPRRIRRSGWPAPMHLAGPLARYRSLSRAERLAVVRAAMALWLSDLSDSDHDEASIALWLSQHGQREHALTELWDAFVTPVLNTSADNADLRTAVGMINAAMLSRRNQADLAISSVPLRDLHGGPAGGLLTALGVELRVSAQVTAIRHEAGRFEVTIGLGDEDQPGREEFGQREADVINAAGVVLAVPAWSAAALVPAELSAPARAWNILKPSPVVSLHVMYSAPVTKLPFALSTVSPMRWIVDKTNAAGLHTGQYLAASIPAADKYVDAPMAALRQEFLPVLERHFPAGRLASVEEFFVTRERSATFDPVPGSSAVRPDQETSLPGFALAGAWTSTGWPDTMEGAVRSGRLAAQSVVATLCDPGAGMGRRWAALRSRIRELALDRSASIQARVETDVTPLGSAEPESHVVVVGRAGEVVDGLDIDAAIVASADQVVEGNDDAPDFGPAGAQEAEATKPAEESVPLRISRPRPARSSARPARKRSSVARATPRAPENGQPARTAGPEESPEPAKVARQ